MQGRHSTRACALLGLALFCVSVPARAQQPALTEPPDPAQPSAAPDAPQPSAAENTSSLANELFAEGTRLFKQWLFEEAEQRFREALRHWDHPLIHLYLSRSLEKQGRLVEAYDALQPALRPGDEPLPPEEVQEAEKLRETLESRLAQLEVHCDEPGAEVYLDGEPWFTAPGRVRRMVGAGQHVLIARKPGYFTLTEPVSLIPGKRTPVAMHLIPDVVHIERRWQPWKPRTVAGVGLAMSLTGGLLLWQASSDYAAIERELGRCSPHLRCEKIPQRRLDRAEWKERIGSGALIVGGSALAVGLAGMLLNLPRSWRSEPARGPRVRRRKLRRYRSRRRHSNAGPWSDSLPSTTTALAP